MHKKIRHGLCKLVQSVKQDNKKVSIDIRHASSFDAQKAIDLLKQIANATDESDMNLSHVNLERLSAKNKVDVIYKNA